MSPESEGTPETKKESENQIEEVRLSEILGNIEQMAKEDKGLVGLEEHAMLDGEPIWDLWDSKEFVANLSGSDISCILIGYRDNRVGYFGAELEELASEILKHELHIRKWQRENEGNFMGENDTEWNVLENAIGWGSYEVQVKVGDGEATIQAVEPVDGYNDKYHQHQISEGNLIATLRCGEDGRCEIIVNTKAVSVESMTKYGAHFGMIVWRVEIPPENFSKKIDVDSTLRNNGVVFKMIGQTTASLEKVEATVVFKL